MVGTPAKTANNSKTNEAETDKEKSTETAQAVSIEQNTTNEAERTMASIIGNIEPYLLGDDFSLYKRRLGHFLSLNKINEDKSKIDVLASFGGADLYKTLHSLIQPKEISDFNYDDLVKKLDEHFAPKKNEIAESFKFYKRDQKSSESIAEYIVELKTLAKDCNFGDFLDRALRDRFICGIANEAIQQRLFNDERITTFEKANEIALTMETTTRNRYYSQWFGTFVVTEKLFGQKRLASQ